MWAAAHSWSPAAHNYTWGVCSHLCVTDTSWRFTSLIICYYSVAFIYFISLHTTNIWMKCCDSNSVRVCVCVCFLCSVTVNDQWNVTTGEGFSLQRCCTLAPSTHFNCSIIQWIAVKKNFFFFLSTMCLLICVCVCVCIRHFPDRI